MESQVGSRKKGNWKIIVFAFLLLVPALAVIHMGAVLIWGYYGFTTVCWNTYADYDNDVSRILTEIFKSELLAPVEELVDLNIAKQRLGAAEIGVKFKEICALYYVDEGEVINNIYLSANTALHDSLIRAEVNKHKDLHPSSSYLRIDSDWQWKTITIETSDGYLQMTLAKKGGHYRIVMIDPDKLKPRLQRIFDNSLPKSFIYDRYFSPKEDYEYEPKAHISLYDSDSDEPFFQYGHNSGEGWINTRYSENGLRSFFFGWKLKTEIYGKHDWMMYFAGQFQKFPWKFAIEAGIALIFIFLSAFFSSKLRKAE